MIYTVVHQIHQRTPHLHIAKLFVTNVPDGTTESELKDALTEAGHEFGEFGIPWANHYICTLSEAEPEVKGVWNRGDAEQVAWNEITNFVYEDSHG